MNERHDSQVARALRVHPPGGWTDPQTDSPAECLPSEDSTNGRNPRDASLRQILKAIVAFRDGDFSVRLPADWPGIDGRIAETFNQTIARKIASRGK